MAFSVAKAKLLPLGDQDKPLEAEVEDKSCLFWINFICKGIKETMLLIDKIIFY